MISKPTKKEWKRERQKILTPIQRSTYSQHITYECAFCKHIFEGEAIYKHLFKRHRDSVYNVMNVRFHPFLKAIEEEEKRREGDKNVG